MESRRVALVTGCGRSDGLGSAVARRLVRSGLAVVVTDLWQTPELQRHEAREQADVGWQGLRSLVEELDSAGHEVVAAVGDVADPDNASSLVATALDRYGRIDVLVNNAAPAHGSEVGPLEDIEPERFDHVYEVIVRGAFLMCKAALPSMRNQGWGRIVNVSSLAAIAGMPNISAYSTMKAAVTGLTRSLAVESGLAGITVNAVLPGMMVTARTAAGRKIEEADRAKVRQEFVDQAASRIPVGRAGDADAVAAMVAFLASEDAWFVTGQSIVVDGGEGLT